MAGGVILWRSRLQSIVATSSTEVEYVAAVPARQGAVWLRRMVAELGWPSLSPTTLWMDNLGAMVLTQALKSHQQTQHIDLQYHFIRECVKDELIKPEWILSTENMADLFTKALTPEVF
ncbi:SubName: Full=Uncharacterized protein {ECO:0000313/EMBL:CCA75293.1} [Serendipita indica DSM 11827]|uniref:Uncharacterized protein n=1 Tax=Serendipita indica (strain DSM 11827) TaxID=1109443 RepID=G4TVF0_SERID|nr:SubName: Full=Uncharacterized protein {ECO:0000313/EMBL:CCA75293.1} [Serendipita indica DSM 11827]CCA75293.1 hypothetical protein PIIN_09277 [Serendipita indica DSM 11827]